MIKMMSSIIAIFFSVNVFAGTPVTNSNVVGKYHIQAQDVYIEALIQFTQTSASMSYRDSSGSLECTGTYTLVKKVLKTTFPNCGAGNINHEISLKSQTLETLTAGSQVNVKIIVNNVPYTTFPFRIKKLN